MRFSGPERRTVSQFAPDLLKVRQIVIDVCRLPGEGSTRMACRLDHARGCRRRSSKFQCHEPGDRNGEVELPEDRLEIGEAASERIDRDDVPVTGGGQRGQAEIQPGPDFLRAACSGTEIGERAGVQLPDQGIGLGEDRREVQIQHDCTVKAAKCNTARRTDRMRHHPGQGREGEDVAAAAEHGG